MWCCRDLGGILGKKQEDLKGTGVFGDPGVAETLQKDVNGIGFNNIGYAYHDKTHKPTKGIAIVPIDVNGNGKWMRKKIYGTLDELMEAIAKENILHRQPAIFIL